MGPKIEELDDTLPDLEEDTSTADSPTVRPNVRRAPMEDLRNNLSSRSPPDRRSPLHPPPDPPRQDSKDDAGLGGDLSGMDMSQLEEMMVRVHRNPSPNPPYRTHPLRTHPAAARTTKENIADVFSPIPISIRSDRRA